MPNADDKGPAAPSLLDSRSVGGLEGWGGYSAQLRYILATLPTWLKDDFFRAFTPERAEDVDVFFEGRVEHHQCKAGSQTPSLIKGYVKEYRERNKAALAAGQDRRFVISTPSPNDDVRGAFQALSRYRKTNFEASDPEAASTLADLSRKFVDAGIVEPSDFDFLRERVELRQDWGGLELDGEPWGRIAGGLGTVPQLDGYVHAELVAAAKELAHAVEARKRYPWRRDEVLALLVDAVERWRAGPPRAAGDVIVFEHQSRAAVRTHPDTSALPERLRAARVLRFTSTHPDLLDPKRWEALPRELASLFADASPLRQAMELARTSPVLYYGFPHIPFAAVVGHRLGEQADLHVVEHDRETGLFAWPATAPSPPPMRAAVTRRGGVGALVLRVGVSAVVKAEHCRIHGGGPISIEVDCALESPARGIVKSAAQAREYARVIRETLDPLVAGNPEIGSVHVFAAVPVSVAVLLGQIASSTGYPATFVYNFRDGDVPPYHWAICLQRAHQPDGLVLPVLP